MLIVLNDPFCKIQTPQSALLLRNCQSHYEKSPFNHLIQYCYNYTLAKKWKLKLQECDFYYSFSYPFPKSIYHCLFQSKMLSYQHYTYVFLPRKVCTLLIKYQLHPCHDMKNFRFNGIRVLCLAWFSLDSIYHFFFIFEYWVQDMDDTWDKARRIKKKRIPRTKNRNKCDRFQELPSCWYPSHFLSFPLPIYLRTSNENIYR